MDDPLCQSLCYLAIVIGHNGTSPERITLPLVHFPGRDDVQVRAQQEGLRRCRGAHDPVQPTESHCVGCEIDRLPVCHNAMLLRVTNTGLGKKTLAWLREYEVNKYIHFAGSNTKILIIIHATVKS